MKSVFGLLSILATVASANAIPSVVFNTGNGWPYYSTPYTSWPYIAAAPVTTYTTAHVAATAALPFSVHTKTQYHSQDELGRATYGHSQPDQTHQAVRDEYGNVQGSYAYVDPTGNEVRVNYVADKGGYRAVTNSAPIEHVRGKRSLFYSAYHPVTYSDSRR